MMAAGSTRVSATVALAVLATAVFSLVRGAAALEYSVGDEFRVAKVGDFISATGTDDLPLEFSDGTRVISRPGARLRVARLRGTGADIVLEEGRVSFDVVPRPGNEWRVTSGPFVALVTGTRFDVEWHAETDTFVFDLFGGDAELEACTSGETLTVHSGERVEASCSRNEHRISRLADHP
jgi:ferric-dicitrate binding protein FerR (iron transport regulator)